MSTVNKKDMHNWLSQHQENILKKWIDRIESNGDKKERSPKSTEQNQPIKTFSKKTNADYSMDLSIKKELRKLFYQLLESLPESHKKTRVGVKKKYQSAMINNSNESFYQTDFLVKMKILSNADETSHLNYPDLLHNTVVKEMENSNISLNSTETKWLETEIQRMSGDFSKSFVRVKQLLAGIRENEIEQGLLSNLPKQSSCPSVYLDKV